MQNNKKVIAVLPAYNAEKTLKQTLHDIPREFVDEIILVDDASADRTAELARSLGLTTFVHEKNLGYGGNQKTCYREALKAGADIVIMIHPDHQYDPTLVPEMIKPLVEERADAVFGSRMLESGRAIKGGMPRWKYVSNKILTAIANAVIGTHLSEYHSGFRAYSREVLESIPFEYNSNDFVFDTEIIVQVKIHNFHIHEIPIPTKYFKDASTVGFWRGVAYGLDILAVLWRYVLHHLRIRPTKQFDISTT